jgi:hypothetical protein
MGFVGIQTATMMALGLPPGAKRHLSCKQVLPLITNVITIDGTDI